MLHTKVSTHALLRENSATGLANKGTLRATPRCWLGAPAPGGLALPSGAPTASQLYAPRGVFLNEELLVVADSGNHRVLIWHGVPQTDGQPADVVLGQPDFTSEGAQAGGRGPERGLHLPTAVGVYAGQLFVADAWNHRILIWQTVPQRSDQAPDLVLGQADRSSVTENRGGHVQATSFYWPYGLHYSGDWFYVADTGNRRVLGWRGLPQPEQRPELLLGQPDFKQREENRGGAIGADTFRWPHDLAGSGETLYVADAGNHRVLGWSPRPMQDRPATLVLGQPDASQAQELAYQAQGPQRLRFPYAIALDGERLAVADTANNRVLLWQGLPTHGDFHPADAVIGQPDFDANGENHWQQVTRDTLCWPYGLHLHGSHLAIADSGNNRVMLWEIDG